MRIGESANTGGGGGGNGSSNGGLVVYYHPECFKCLACQRAMLKGDEFVLRAEGIYCKMDFDQQRYVQVNQNYHHHHQNHRKANSIGSSSSPTSSTSGSINGGSSNSNSSGGLLVMSSLKQADEDLKTQVAPTSSTTTSTSTTTAVTVKPATVRKSSSRRVTKRPRTILNPAQRQKFREAFKESQKPCRKKREALAHETNLSVRVVQVWFQNERAKVSECISNLENLYQKNEFRV